MLFKVCARCRFVVANKRRLCETCGSSQFVATADELAADAPQQPPLVVSLAKSLGLVIRELPRQLADARQRAVESGKQAFETGKQAIESFRAEVSSGKQ
jgi:hypothetical protein